MIAFPGSVNLLDAVEIENGNKVNDENLTRWYFEAKLINLQRQASIVPDIKSKEYKDYRIAKFEINKIANKLSEF
jgi:hypothetical protein